MRVAAILALVLLAGCAQLHPAAFPAPASELGDRPGLLSGPTGNLTVFHQ